MCRLPVGSREACYRTVYSCNVAMNVTVVICVEKIPYA